jgi:hypothetical protein
MDAVTVTRSRPADADNDCGDGGVGESQNHEAAPVRPAVCLDGLASIVPVGRASRVATVMARTAGVAAGVVAGFSGASGGGAHGILFGSLMHADSTSGALDDGSPLLSGSLEPDPPSLFPGAPGADEDTRTAAPTEAWLGPSCCEANPTR